MVWVRRRSWESSGAPSRDGYPDPGFGCRTNDIRRVRSSTTVLSFPMTASQCHVGVGFRDIRTHTSDPIRPVTFLQTGQSAKSRFCELESPKRPLATSPCGQERALKLARASGPIWAWVVWLLQSYASPPRVACEHRGGARLIEQRSRLRGHFCTARFQGSRHGIQDRDFGGLRSGHA